MTCKTASTCTFSYWRWAWSAVHVLCVGSDFIWRTRRQSTTTTSTNIWCPTRSSI